MHIQTWKKRGKVKQVSDMWFHTAETAITPEKKNLKIASDNNNNNNNEK